MPELTESQIQCPLCEGRGKIADTRAEAIHRLILACQDMSDSELNEVILYAQYLKARRRKAG